jgi:hypothetical protein
MQHGVEIAAAIVRETYSVRKRDVSTAVNQTRSGASREPTSGERFDGSTTARG